MLRCEIVTFQEMNINAYTDGGKGCQLLLGNLLAAVGHASCQRNQCIAML